MLIRRIVVLSGFGGRVAEALKRYLSDRQIRVVIARQDLDFETYLSNLIKNLYDAIRNLEESSTANFKIIGLLASCQIEKEKLSQESDAFFPLLRRKAFGAQDRNDINKVVFVAEQILETFQSGIFSELSYKFKKPIDERLLLPLRNTPSKKLINALLEIYNLLSANLPANLSKEITPIRKQNAWAVKGLEFKSAHNSEKHPVRRCSDTVWCDLASKIRLGFQVDSHFEFDVTSHGGLSRKLFYLCDGTAVKVPREADHLNMRINDDFKW